MKLKLISLLMEVKHKQTVPQLTRLVLRPSGKRQAVVYVIYLIKGRSQIHLCFHFPNTSGGGGGGGGGTSGLCG